MAQGTTLDSLPIIQSSLIKKYIDTNKLQVSPTSNRKFASLGLYEGCICHGKGNGVEQTVEQEEIDDNVCLECKIDTSPIWFKKADDGVVCQLCNYKSRTNYDDTKVII